jgi:hypothetical protein
VVQTVKSERKAGFLLYYQHYDYIQDLSIEEKAELLDAIYLYAINGKIPNFKGSLNTVFKVIKSQLDISAKNYKTTCDKNAGIAKEREANKKRLRDAAAKAAAEEAVKIAIESKEKDEALHDGLALDDDAPGFLL